MTDYIQDLATIRGIMEKRTKFISLSGLSGILAGIYALIGAYLAYRTIYFSDNTIYSAYRNGIWSPEIIKLLVIGFSVLILASLTGLILSMRKAKKLGQNFWNPSALRMISSFLVPLTAGGIFVMILIWRGQATYVAPALLLFYGVAVYTAGNFTFSDVKTLGILEIILGLLAALYPGKGLLFWTIGFGGLHILYGAIMYFKYER